MGCTMYEDMLCKTDGALGRVGFFYSFFSAPYLAVLANKKNYRAAGLLSCWGMAWWIRDTDAVGQ